MIEAAGYIIHPRPRVVQALPARASQDSDDIVDAVEGGGAPAAPDDEENPFGEPPDGEPPQDAAGASAEEEEVQIGRLKAEAMSKEHLLTHEPKNPHVRIACGQRLHTVSTVTQDQSEIELRLSANWSPPITLTRIGSPYKE